MNIKEIEDGLLDYQQGQYITEHEGTEHIIYATTNRKGKLRDVDVFECPDGRYLMRLFDDTVSPVEHFIYEKPFTKETMDELLPYGYHVDLNKTDIEF